MHFSRFTNPPLPENYVLSKRGRGSAVQYNSENEKAIFTRWYESVYVCIVVDLVSNFVRYGIADKARRWEKFIGLYHGTNEFIKYIKRDKKNKVFLRLFF